MPSSHPPEHEDDYYETDPFLYDPSQPPHPIFNLHPTERLAQHLRAIEDREREPFEKEWGEVVRRVKAKEFTSRSHLAKVFKKDWLWAARITALMIKQGVVTQEELGGMMMKKMKKTSQRGEDLEHDNTVS